MTTGIETRLTELAKLVRYYILTATTAAGSGHPSSSLSAVELLIGLMFGGTFRFDVAHPDNPNNDRLIFSKGHASPLFYALWAAAGAVREQELMTMRKFGSPLEGHPAMGFPYVEAATGSLGQGLSIGLGMAMNAKYLDRLPYQTYVLLGDSEMAEGSVWEAMQVAAKYRLNNLTGIIDVNRLGQRGETMYGHDLAAYEQRVAAFGWGTLVVDGHALPEVLEAFAKARTPSDKPTMIIARTIKGKGVSFIEDKNGWHGKVLKKEECARALLEIGDIDYSLRGITATPEEARPQGITVRPAEENGYELNQPIATRRAYGEALIRLYPQFPEIVALDGEVSNSTYAEIFGSRYPGRFFEMYIAEQNMVGAALGLSRRGKIPFVSTFAAFFTRAFDQIRMSQYSAANIKFVGSHAGVSIGEDGPSQMGLEDLAMFRTLLGGVVLYPADAVATERLVKEAAKHRGLVYIRTTRKDTPVIYNNLEEFVIGGSKVLRRGEADRITVVGAGITLYEALAAYEELWKEDILIRVIDLYSIKPIDALTLKQAAESTKAIITVEDHYAEGGLGEAVRSALAGVPIPVHALAVRRMPKSGKPEELLDYEDISRQAIIKKIKELL